MSAAKKEDSLSTETYNSVQKGDLNLVSCPPIVAGDEGNLELSTKTWLLMNVGVHVFDFRNVLELKKTAYHIFISFHSRLKIDGKSLFLLNTSAPIGNQIAQDGMKGVFTLIKDVSEATNLKSVSAGAAAAKPRAGYRVEFINPFIEATKTVFETQANTAMKAMKPYIKPTQTNLPMEIAGVISLASPAFTGSVSICFQSAVFLKIYENMVGEKHESISHEIEDAAGEILNMIFGQAKTILNDKNGQAFEKAIPTVLVGEKLRLRQQGNGAALIIPFESSAGNIHLEIFVEEFGK